MNENDDLLKKAQELENNNLWDKAAQQYCKVLVYNSSIKIHEKVAWCFSRAGKYAPAIEHLEVLIQKEPQNAQWPYMMGYQFYCQNNWTKATEWFEKALTINPDYFKVKYRLAYAYFKLAGDYKKLTKHEYWKALSHLEDCHKLWSNFSEDEQKKEKNIYFEINFRHGKIMMDLPDRRTEAIPLFQKALEIKPDDENSKYNLAKTYYLLGEYIRAKQSMPASSNHFIIILNAHIDAKLENYASAINQIKSLLQKREKDYLYSFLAEVYLLTNDLDNAYHMAEKAITLGRNNHKNYYVAARVYYKFGLLLKAVSTLDEAIQLKEKKYNSEYIECKNLRDEINSKISPGYSDDVELIKRLTDNNTANTKPAHKGTICKYFQPKGYGFINSKGNEIFFHISNCKFKDVNIGDKVVFLTEKTIRGINAIDIKRI